MEGSLKELTTLLYNEAQMVYKHNFIDYLKKLCAINYRVYSNRTQAKKIIIIITFARFLIKVVSCYIMKILEFEFVVLIRSCSLLEQRQYLYYIQSSPNYMLLYHANFPQLDLFR